MKELMFRAWDTAEKKWICKDFHLMGEMMMGGILFERPVERFNDVLVEESTGLKDRNGNPIYMGDIVKAGDDVVQVIWSEKFASFCVSKVGWAFFHFFGEAVEAHRCEVIGNIHDDPEMLT